MDDILLPIIEVTWPPQEIPGGVEDLLGAQSPFPAGSVGVVNVIHTGTAINTTGPGGYTKAEAPALGNAPVGSYLAAYYQQLGPEVAAAAIAQEHSYKFAVAAIVSTQQRLDTATKVRYEEVSPPTLMKPNLLPPEEFNLSRKYNDYTDPTTWLDTIGLYGPVSVPIANVTPINRPQMDIPSLSGLTFQTPGMLFDVGLPHLPWMP